MEYNEVPNMENNGSPNMENNASSQHGVQWESPTWSTMESPSIDQVRYYMDCGYGSDLVCQACLCRISTHDGL